MPTAAVAAFSPSHIKVALIAALYVLWLATWLVFGTEIYGAGHYYWDQALAAAVTGLIALFAARRAPGPYPAFLAIQGVAFLVLALAWVSYPVGEVCPTLMFLGQVFDEGRCTLIADSIYALSIFTMLFGWGYLALGRWHARSVSVFTILVFAFLMFGLGVIFTTFYYHQYAGDLSNPDDRLDAVSSALEFAVLVAGLLCMLLRVRAVVIWMLVGTVIQMAGDMAYVTSSVHTDMPPTIDAVWMLGQIVLLAAVVSITDARVRDGLRSDTVSQDVDESQQRSGLSGILILISLGAVLLSPLVWFLPVHEVWKSFFAVLFVIALVVVLVWITDRFDDAVSYLRAYVRRVHESRLASEDWRAAPVRVRRALETTGLGAFVEAFRASAAQLKRDVLFLGPERLYQAPRDLATPRRASCFIVMPFSQEWSADVHRILASACEAVGVRAVRGDDLFTPTDILEDIWQSINAADFVIADITGRNPNVLYELGIAHTLAKPVLILSKQASDIPIDLATRRVLLYGQPEGDWREDLRHKSQAALAAIVQEYALAVAPR